MFWCVTKGCLSPLRTLSLSHTRGFLCIDFIYFLPLTQLSVYTIICQNQHLKCSLLSLSALIYYNKKNQKKQKKMVIKCFLDEAVDENKYSNVTIASSVHILYVCFNALQYSCKLYNANNSESSSSYK